MTQVLVWSMIAALGTAIGSAAVYLMRSPSQRVLDGAVGFAAGVMVSATLFGLVPAAQQEMGDLGVAAWVVVGFAAIGVMDRLVPHTHTRHADTSGYPSSHDASVHKARLLALALTLHNIPEGMAVGTAFAAGGASLGVPLALAIAAHNIPEGFAVSGPAVAAGAPLRRTAVLGALTGIVEVPAMLAAYLLAQSVDAAIAPMLAIAAGAMLYVVFDELLPDAARHGNERFVASWVLVGTLALFLLQGAAADLAR